MTDLSADRVVSTVLARAAEKSAAVQVFWLRYHGDRATLQAAIRAARGQAAVVPLVVRSGFQNANAVHDDLAAIVEENRAEFQHVERYFSVANPVLIVLVARSDLGIPQVASPAVLPSWLAGVGGSTIDVMIENLSVRATAPLNVAESRLDEIAELLFGLEGVLLQRLTHVRSADHRKTSAFLELIRDAKRADEKHEAILVAAGLARQTVQHPTSYRPSAGDARSLVGRIMRLVSSRSPDALHGAAEALGGALGAEIGIGAAHEAFAAVLLRSTIRTQTPTVRFARSLLVSVFCSSQFLTAAAHSDDYSPYLVLLLQSGSYDLRQALAESAAVIQGLPDST